MGGGNAGGLAWIITGGLLFHNGGTGGFSASVAIDQAAGPEWAERAREMAQALLDGKFTEIRRQLRPEGRANLSADRLGQMWHFALQQIGDPGPVSVSCRSLAAGTAVPGEVAALITFAGSKQQLRLFVRFTASGQIAFLRVLGLDEVAPW